MKLMKSLSILLVLVMMFAAVQVVAFASIDTSTDASEESSEAAADVAADEDEEAPAADDDADEPATITSDDIQNPSTGASSPLALMAAATVFLGAATVGVCKRK